MPFFYRRALRPLLFRLDPETAHQRVAGLCRAAARIRPLAALLRSRSSIASERLASEVLGLRFPNPVGVAAGFDKAGDLYPFLSAAGFGFVESGTFTRLEQEGNPRPRLFRFAAEGALVNRMGFNNPGAEKTMPVLARQRLTIPRGISIGKSRAAALSDAAADQAAAVEILARYADYLAINVSSPNTPGLRELQDEASLRDIVVQVRAAMTRGGALGRPLLVKLAPDFADREFDRLVLSMAGLGVDGLILTNTTVRREGLPAAQHVVGGLSGAPLRTRSTELVRRAYRLTAGGLPIIGVGGVASGPDALEKIRAGASLVQVYTGYVFEGPGLPRAINRHLDAECLRRGCTINELVGSEKDE